MFPRRLLLLAALLFAACRVDLGAPPDAAPCTPSPDYFADPLWLAYFDADGCASPQCHGTTEGHGYLRLHPPGTAPAPGTPLADWPPSWRANYWNVVQLVRCDDILQSRVLTVPSNRGDPHPSGDWVQDKAAADALFRDWAAAH